MALFLIAASYLYAVGYGVSWALGIVARAHYLDHHWSVFAKAGIEAIFWPLRLVVNLVDGLVL